MATELIHGALILGGRTGGDGYEGGRWLINSREPRLFSCSIKSYVLLHLPPIQRSFQSSLCTMQLSLSFSFLLTTLLFTLAQVEAFPTKRSPRTVTLPLKRLSQPSDVHPSIVIPTFDLSPGRTRGAHYASFSFYNGVSITPAAAMRGWLAVKGLPPQSWRGRSRSGCILPSFRRTTRDQMQRSGKYFIFSTSVRPERSLSIHFSGLSFENVYNQGPDPKDGFPETGLDPLISGDLTKANKPTADNSLGLDIL